MKWLREPILWGVWNMPDLCRVIRRKNHPGYSFQSEHDKIHDIFCNLSLEQARTMLNKNESWMQTTGIFSDHCTKRDVTRKEVKILASATFESTNEFSACRVLEWSLMNNQMEQYLIHLQFVSSLIAFGGFRSYSWPFCSSFLKYMFRWIQSWIVSLLLR